VEEFSIGKNGEIVNKMKKLMLSNLFSPQNISYVIIIDLFSMELYTCEQE
jgi:hypothetical protein